MRDPASLRRPVMLSTDEIAPVWVLDDPYDDSSSQAIGVAERLGVPHLRVPLSWRWQASWIAGLSSRGSLRGLQAVGWPFSAPRGPALAISASARSEPVARWLRSGFGTRIVHCGLPRFRARQFDLLVAPRHLRPPESPNVLPVLGQPHRLSPLALSQAKVAWAGRLSHLPRPMITLLVGGGGRGPLRPSSAHALGRQVARAAAAAGGSVLATTTSHTGEDATDALAEGLSPCMHLLYRWGEPGENPYAAMIALADVIITTGGSAAMLSEACGGEAPVFIASLGDTATDRRLHETLYRAGQARPFGHTVSPWPRAPLDEAGRVAAEIRARMSIGPQAVD